MSTYKKVNKVEYHNDLIFRLLLQLLLQLQLLPVCVHTHARMHAHTHACMHTHTKLPIISCSQPHIVTIEWTKIDRKRENQWVLVYEVHRYACEWLHSLSLGTIDQESSVESGVWEEEQWLQD